jgi:hypothetical protein
MPRKILTKKTKEIINVSDTPLSPKTPGNDVVATIGNLEIYERSLERIDGTRDNGYLDDDGVLGFMCSIKTNKKIFFFNNRQSTQIVMSGKLDGRQIRTKFNEYDYIAGPVYVESMEHWCLLFVSIIDAEVTYLDPLKHISKESKKAAKEKQIDVLEKWSMFVKTRNGLKDKEWKMKEYNQYHQPDAFSCGVFVCKYFENLIKGEYDLLQNYFNVQQYRTLIRETIIQQ